jgi:hypothetical protein
MRSPRMQPTTAKLTPFVRRPRSAARGLASLDQPRDVADLDLIARWMDDLVRIPGLKLGLGADAVLGLIPGVGDAAGAMVSLYLMNRARRMGVGRATLLRMIANVAIDFVAGAVPVAGDVFDAYWQANRRNVALVRRHATALPTEERRLDWSDRIFVAVAALVVLTFAAASAASAYFIVTWLFGAVQSVFA